MAIAGFFSFIFVFSIQLIVQINFKMTAVELEATSYRYNYATTSAHCSSLYFAIKPIS